MGEDFAPAGAQGVAIWAEYVKNGFKVNANIIDDAFRHVDEVTLNGAGKPTYSSGNLVGCHNEVNFNAQKISNGGRIQVISESPAGVNGVKTIEYKTLQLDALGNQIPGQYIGSGSVYIKTLFDPTVFSELTMKDLGYKAFKDAMVNNKFDLVDPLTGNTLPRTFEGIANGRTISGYYKTINGENVINTWWVKN